MAAFSCSKCDSLIRSYVGDGFDEFYEWKCGATKKKKLIGHEEHTFPKLPVWCPEARKLMARMKVKVNPKKVS